jgi:hypothetical protein
MLLEVFKTMINTCEPYNLGGFATSVVQSCDNQGHSLLKRNNHYGSNSIELDPFQIARIRILDPSQSLFQFEDPERFFHSHLQIFAISEYFRFYFSIICLSI